MYEKRGTLGQGAFSTVVLIDWEGGHAALKTYDREKSREKAKFILGEKEVLSRISQGVGGRYVVNLLDTAKDDVNLYFVMEAALGGPLHKHMNQMHRADWPPQLALRYGAEVASALMHLARHGCLHRDVKASNCLLTADGHVKLCDFGSSRVLFEAAAWSSVLKEGPWRAPKAETLVGTYHMIAPEMISRVGYTLSADWWSLGALLYEMVAKVPAFPRFVGRSLSDATDFDPDEYEVHFCDAYTHSFQGCMASIDACAALKSDTCALISSLLTVRASSRASPWTFEDMQRNPCWATAGVDWVAIEAGTAPPPNATFDRRLGALDLVANDGDRGEGKEGDPALSKDEQDLFATY